MPIAKVNFLNWRPDAEDVGNDGLTQADNVLHDTEGYRPVHLESSGAFSTAIAASNATVLSAVAMPVGSSGDVFAAWIADATTPTLAVGINGATLTSTATGHPLAFAGTAVNPEIYAFDICEYGGYIVWTVEAQAEDTGGTVLSVAYAGIATY